MQAQLLRALGSFADLLIFQGAKCTMPRQSPTIIRDANVKTHRARLTLAESGCYSREVPFGFGFDFYDRWPWSIRQDGLNINPTADGSSAATHPAVR